MIYSSFKCLNSTHVFGEWLDIENQLYRNQGLVCFMISHNPHYRQTNISYGCEEDVQGFGLFPQVLYCYLFLSLLARICCLGLFTLWKSLIIVSLNFVLPSSWILIIPVQLSTAEGLIIESIITAYGFASSLAALPSRPVFPYLLAVLE